MSISRGWCGRRKGEGLGNQFLANIRECDAIAHVLRCFEDDDVTHVEGRVDPIADAETIETELMLADMESIERRLQNLSRKVRGGDKEAMQQERAAEIGTGRAGRGAAGAHARDRRRGRKGVADAAALTSKPVLYVCNVAEDEAATGNELTREGGRDGGEQAAGTVVISAQIEEEIAQLDAAEAADFLDSLGLEQAGLDRLIRAGYDLLGLQTYFTVGPKEARAWTIKHGTLAPQAAGVIHGDFERGFIRAETIAYNDFVACGGEQGAKDAGKMRVEGKNYEVKDGDVLHFLFNA